MNKKLYHIFFIDDDKDFLRSVEMLISSKLLSHIDEVEVAPHFVSNPREGLSFIQELVEEQEKIAVIVSDQQMPEMTGIEFIEQVKNPSLSKILIILQFLLKTP